MRTLGLSGEVCVSLESFGGVLRKSCADSGIGSAEIMCELWALQSFGGVLRKSCASSGLERRSLRMSLETGLVDWLDLYYHSIPLPATICAHLEVYLSDMVCFGFCSLCCLMSPRWISASLHCFTSVSGITIAGYNAWYWSSELSLVFSAILLAYRW